MKQWLPCCSRWVVLLLISILIGTGCNGSERTTPNPSPPPAYLRALRIMVERVRERQPIQVSEDGLVDINKDDQIRVNEQGRGLLRFPDRLQVEIFRGTNLELEEAELEPGDSFLAILRQNAGHAQYKLNEERDNRIQVMTDYAVITALGTDFVVCHAPELTCMVTLAGEVEVQGQDQVVTVRAGESAYVLPGQPPIGPICADIEEVRRWLDQKRSATDKEPLGALVTRWPQHSCSQASSPPSPSPEVAAAPTSATPIPEPIATPTSSVPIPTPESAATTPAPTPPQPVCMVLPRVLNLHPGPGFWPPLATLYTGMQLDPLARNFNGQWLQVRVRESGQIGWVTAKPACISCNIAAADLAVTQ